MEDVNVVLHTDITKLSVKADSERLKLQKELQKENGNTALQTKTVALLRSTNQYFNTNIDSLAFEVVIPQKDETMPSSCLIEIRHKKLC